MKKSKKGDEEVVKLCGNCRCYLSKRTFEFVLINVVLWYGIDETKRAYFDIRCYAKNARFLAPKVFKSFLTQLV